MSRVKRKRADKASFLDFKYVVFMGNSSNEADFPMVGCVEMRFYGPSVRF